MNQPLERFGNYSARCLPSILIRSKSCVRVFETTKAQVERLGDALGGGRREKYLAPPSSQKLAHVSEVIILTSQVKLN